MHCGIFAQTGVWLKTVYFKPVLFQIDKFRHHNCAIMQVAEPLMSKI